MPWGTSLLILQLVISSWWRWLADGCVLVALMALPALPGHCPNFRRSHLNGAWHGPRTIRPLWCESCRVPQWKPCWPYWHQEGKRNQPVWAISPAGYHRGTISERRSVVSTDDHTDLGGQWFKQWASTGNRHDHASDDGKPDWQLLPWNPHDVITATSTSGIPGISRPCQWIEETPICCAIDWVPQDWRPVQSHSPGISPKIKMVDTWGLSTCRNSCPEHQQTAQDMPAHQQALQSVGVPSSTLPQIEIVSPALRNDIIQGKGANLVSLLIQGLTSEGELGQRTAVAKDDVVPLKPLPDHRLTRQLTITEFVKAYMIYRDIMREVYPHRRSELDAYLRLIVDMATDFGAMSQRVPQDV